MKAQKASPDRLLVPIFRAFSTSLGFGERSLVLTPDGATLWVHAGTDDHDHPVATYHDEVQTKLLLDNGVNTMVKAMEYGHQAGHRARDALARLKVTQATMAAITDELPIIFRENGRVYKIIKLVENPWVCWWHPNDQWVTLRAATFAEITKAKHLRVTPEEANQLDAVHEANNLSIWDGHQPTRLDTAEDDPTGKRQPSNRERALAVPCPECHADAGKRCLDLRRRTKPPMVINIHPARYRASHPWRAEYPLSDKSTARP